MNDWTRVVLYGTYDGFTHSTDGLSQINVVLDGGEKVEVPKEFVLSADQMVNKNKIKLKDVIKRIKGFDVDAKKVWLDEIWNELGSDYGSLKYKAGYEQGKLEGAWVGQQLKDADKIRQEINKPVVPQFVADWYEEYKGDLEYNVWEWFVHGHKKSLIGYKRKFFAWLNSATGNPIQTLVNMHQFGYDVEKEKRYRVRMKGLDLRTKYLYYGMGSKTWLFKPELIDGLFRKTHTRKELENAGFVEVFNSPLFEVEEVTE